MVLENSSASVPTDSIDSVPVSDNDPYAPSSNQTALLYQLDRTKLSRPLPIIGPLFGFNDELFDRTFKDKILTALNVIKRPLTQEEVDAMAYHHAKQLTIMSNGPLMGISGGIYRAYSTAATFRFPFYQPNLETFDKSSFPSAKYPYIKGGRAIIFWNVLRYGAYSWVGKYIAQILIGGYAASVTTIGQMSDSRLKKVVDAMREEAKKRNGSNLPSPAGIPRPPMRPGQQPQGQNIPQDDASPTGGMFDYNEDQTQTSNAPATQRNSWPQPQQQARQLPIQNQEEDKGGFDMFGDDASPTGGRGMNSDMIASSQSSNSGGSAWDKIRRGERPARQTSDQKSGWGRIQSSNQREQRDGSTSGDSFTFSKTDEERSFAKDEAQKEFDAKVERERRGGDFSSGGGDQRRW